MRFIITLLVVLLSPSSVAQSLFFESAESSEAFSQVVPGQALEFPKDHLPHPDFRLEWWYLTANLQDTEGRQWGLQWTLFRQALDAKPQMSGWSSNQMWMAHAAVTTPDKHRFEQRFARGGIGQAEVVLEDNQFDARIDDWLWTSPSPSMFPARLNYSVDELQVLVNLEAAGPFVLQGENGYSQKSASGQASYYYSLPFIEISGTVTINGEEITLNGEGWLDREWSTEPLSDEQTGWDWFSLHLNQGEKLMVYRLRQKDGNPWLKGTWIDSERRVHALDASQIRLEEIGSRTIHLGDERTAKLPLDWRIELPEFNRIINLTPLYDQQWMATAISYWEGVMLARDENDQPMGRGYMELTGYDTSIEE